MSPLHFLEPICDSCKESRHTHSYHVLTYHPILHHTPQQWVPEGNSTIFISNDLWHKLFCAKEFPLNMRIKVGALYDTYIYIYISLIICICVSIAVLSADAHCRQKRSDQIHPKTRNHRNLAEYTSSLLNCYHVTPDIVPLFGFPPTSQV